jgi:hypothetical protein
VERIIHMEVLAVIGLVDNLISIYGSLDGLIRDFAGLADSSADLRVRLEAEKVITLGLRDALFDPENGTFRLLNQRAQLSIYDAFRQYSSQFEDFLPLERRYRLTLQGESPSAPNIRDRMAWSVGQDKKKVLKLLEDFTFWNQKVEQILKVHLLTLNMPLEKKAAKLQTAPLKLLGMSNAIEALQAAETGYHGKTFRLPISGLEDNGRLETLHTAKYNFRTVLVDSKIYDDAAAAGEMINQLVAVLQQLSYTSANVPKCIGYIDRSDQGCFSLLFETQNSVSIRPNISTLYQMLPVNSQSSGPPLEQRLRLAYMLAFLLWQFQAVSWVHKNVSSKGVVFVDQPGPDTIPAKVLFLGFEFARPRDSLSSMSSSTGAADNVYRHPMRWGLPTVKFQPIHDVYALGVVLLEIGLWRRATSLIRTGVEAPEVVKETLLTYATVRLRYCAGSNYSEIVLRCLEGEMIASDEVTPPQGLTEPFYNTVIEPLGRLSRIFSSDG